jgi:hypothetical protein
LRFCIAIWNLCAVCLLTASLSLTLAETRQWSVSHSATLKDRVSSVLEYRLLSIQIWSIRLCVVPFSDAQVNLWMLRFGKIVLLRSNYLNVASPTVLFAKSEWSSQLRWDGEDL